MNNNHIFRVAILQKASYGLDYDANTRLVIDEMKNAAANDSDILLIPECFITGYDLPIDNADAIDDNDRHLCQIRTAAKDLHIGVVATALTKGSTKPQNSAYIISKEGNILMKYSKVHTCDFADEACLESGEEFKVCDFHGVQLGVMICYDREYPESARVLMLKGAEIILSPNDCGAMAPRLRALSTYAYVNMVGIAMANPPGANWGNSCAYSPVCWDRSGNCVDNTILMADAETPGLYFADFDLNALRDYRNREMMGNTFRKVKAYAALLDNHVEPPFIRERGDKI